MEMVQNIDKIITESINRVLFESISESAKDKIAALVKKGKKDTKKDKDSEDDKKKNSTKKSGEKIKKNYRRKKLGGGRWITYDKDEYDKENPDANDGDATVIRNRIDTDLTNIAALARKVFPGHTDEGAQSQLRKILNGERPMKKKDERKLNNEISAGNVATKS